MATIQGTVAKVTSDPAGFTVHSPLPPPDGTNYPFTPVSDKQWAIANAAFGQPITVTTNDETGVVTGVSRP